MSRSSVYVPYTGTTSKPVSRSFKIALKYIYLDPKNKQVVKYINTPYRLKTYEDAVNFARKVYPCYECTILETGQEANTDPIQVADTAASYDIEKLRVENALLRQELERLRQSNAFSRATLAQQQRNYEQKERSLRANVGKNGTLKSKLMKQGDKAKGILSQGMNMAKSVVNGINEADKLFSNPGMFMPQQGMMNPAMMNPAMMNPAMMNPAMMNPAMMNPAMMMQQQEMPASLGSLAKVASRFGKPGRRGGSRVLTQKVSQKKRKTNHRSRKY